MAQYGNDLDAAAQVLDSISEAAEHFVAQGVAGDANDKQVIGAFVEDELNRDARIRASENRSERALFRTGFALYRDPQILRIDIDDALCDGIVVIQGIEQRCKSAVSLLETLRRRVRIHWPWSRR
jgi:hypothetical protein